MLDMIMAYARAAFAEMRDHEEGQTLVEYALILVFVSIASIAALTALGLKVGTVLDSITTAL
jgi:Flp pilus assembly pilin Flp